ncbi:hypothetical protein MTO96_000942 [Rhipicephalus appendiculatus]
MDLESYKHVDGVSMHGWYHEEMIRSALSYKPRSDDIFIVTYPKSGTTWMQYVILSILGEGKVPRTFVDYMLTSPHLELLGEEGAGEDAQTWSNQDSPTFPQGTELAGSEVHMRR